jgi:[acyl-carrier-protein] S-malonyltransferase
VGMGQELLEQFPALKVVFEEVEDATSLSIRKLCLQGPDDQLKLTEFTQPCILAVSIAMWRCLTQESPLAPSFFAGHSLGEYSALVASGKLSLSRAAYLVHQRGRAMQQAVPIGVGAMAAILQVPEVILRGLCLEAAAEAFKLGGPPAGAGGASKDSLQDPDQEIPHQQVVLEIVNFNAPTQLVVAGHKRAVDLLLERIGEVKGKGVLLPVSAPFHSSLMLPARKLMAELLKNSTFVQNEQGIIANTTAGLTRDYQWQILADQIHSPVLWYQTIETALKHGCRSFVEIGPGKVLSGLAKRQVPRDSWLQNSENFVGLIQEVQKRFRNL